MGGVRSTSADSIGCFSLTRPNLQRTLYAALPPGTVTCEASFRSFALREDGRVEVTLAVSGGYHGGNGSIMGGSGGTQAQGSAEGAGGEGAEAVERVEVCDILVGADGIRSRVRTCLEGGWGGVVVRAAGRLCFQLAEDSWGAAGCWLNAVVPVHNNTCTLAPVVPCQTMYAPACTLLAERQGIEARHPQYSGYAYNRGLVDLSQWPGG